jgi:phosphoribosylformylglycinamidine cyclo-ligase
MKDILTYRDSGVDIDAGDRFIDAIRPSVRRTFRREVLMDIGGFGGIVELDTKRFPDPLLVASTDGVGTKLRVAFEMDRHETIGLDLVAMCANDVVVHGAEPLFFLDYFATGRLDPDKATKVVQGIAEGCQLAGCSLIGGETAEMPSFYPGGEYDVAGFCVGIVNRDRLLNGLTICPGDVLVGLASSGLHSNGYSLVRKLYSRERGYSLEAPLEGMDVPLGEVLLQPTRIYVRLLLDLLEHFPIKGIAHITGGGLHGNIPRILPQGCGVRIDRSRWPIPLIFQRIQADARLPASEMVRTFNCGIGMVFVLEAQRTDAVFEFLRAGGETFFHIGDVVERREGDPPVEWVSGGR